MPLKKKQKQYNVEVKCARSLQLMMENKKWTCDFRSEFLNTFTQTLNMNIKQRKGSEIDPVLHQINDAKWMLPYMYLIHLVLKNEIEKLYLLRLKMLCHLRVLRSMHSQFVFCFSFYVAIRCDMKQSTNTQFLWDSFFPLFLCSLSLHLPQYLPNRRKRDDEQKKIYTERLL